MYEIVAKILHCRCRYQAISITNKLVLELLILTYEKESSNAESPAQNTNISDELLKFGSKRSRRIR